MGEHSYSWFNYGDLKKLIDLDRIATLSGLVRNTDYDEWDKISEPKHMTHLSLKSKLIVAKMTINGSPNFASGITDDIGEIWTPEEYAIQLAKCTPVNETDKNGRFNLHEELNKIAIPENLRINVSWSKSYAKLLDIYFIEFVKNLGIMAEMYGEENVRWIIGFDS